MVEGSIRSGSCHFPLLGSQQQQHSEEDEAVMAVDHLPPSPMFWHQRQHRDMRIDLSACTDTPIHAPTCADEAGCMEKLYSVKHISQGTNERAWMQQGFLLLLIRLNAD